jgi:outer membrane lipoprotein-sorting protein
MTMRGIAGVALTALWIAAAAAPAPQAPPPAKPTLNATQIIEKNVAARGGLDAWRKVETMAWTGHVQGDAAQPMPFVMELKRPNKTHFEIATTDKRFTRIFDGVNGWRLRPGGNGLPEVKPFSKEEVTFSRSEFVVDGPLIDHEAKGVTVKLAGLDEIEGRKAYLLEVVLPGGANRRIWVDAESFLEIRSDRPSTSPLTKGTPISVYYRDYRPVDGLLVPHTIETRSSSGGGSTQTLVIDKIALNPALPVTAFAKPWAPRQRNATVRIGGDPRAPAPPPVSAAPAGSLQ